MYSLILLSWRGFGATLCPHWTVQHHTDSNSFQMPQSRYRLYSIRFDSIAKNGADHQHSMCLLNKNRQPMNACMPENCIYCFLFHFVFLSHCSLCVRNLINKNIVGVGECLQTRIEHILLHTLFSTLIYIIFTTVMSPETCSFASIKYGFIILYLFLWAFFSCFRFMFCLHAPNSQLVMRI